MISAEALVPPAKPAAPLDDVMLAMDVVDTLRHRDQLVAKELGEADREEDLIAQLRTIYRNQGLAVSDEILRQGVKALREERFVYKPPRESVSIKLARVYVQRGVWGKWVIGAVTALSLGLGMIGYNSYVASTELSSTIPAALDRLAGDIAADATLPAVRARATAIVTDGKTAARDGRAVPARAAVATLENLRNEVRAEYDIRIVSRPGESTGVWRTPAGNPGAARSYYLIVEAIGADGKALSRAITAETDGKLEVVTKWGQRVPEQLYRQIEAEKRQSGLIQNPILGRKVRGQLEPTWQVSLPGGTITRW